MNTKTIRKNDKRLKAFVEEVTSTLIEGRRHQTPGLGTFSTCTRKASAGQPACKIAMFRASTELRDYSTGGKPPKVSGDHTEIVKLIIEAMQSDEGIEIPKLGRMAVEPVKGKSPKLIFHGANELNNALSATL